MRDLKAAEVRAILGIPPSTLDGWIDKGLIRPTVARPGKGNDRHFSPVAVLAIAAGRWLRQKGVTLAAAGDAVEIIATYTPAGLAREFRAGRTHLPIGPGCEHLVAPTHLLTGDQLCLFDLAAAWANLQREVEKLARQSFGLEPLPA